MRNVKKILVTLSILLLLIYIYQLTQLTGGFFFSSFFYVIIISIFITFCITLFTYISKFIFKKQNFLIRLLFVAIIILSITIYKLYSPTLKIIVPKNYSGEVNLTLSNLDHDELNIDENGIGYITKWTFEKTYTKPKVYDTDGNNLSYLLLSYDNNKFWGKSIGTGNTIRSLNFEIAKDSQQKERTYISRWLENVDLNKVYLENPTKKPDNILEVKVK
ncbi:hypothetical protein LNQ81_15370 [Myroides sp. M-43]|uniref:hypothetical protein n=1 Tax=Myroides oncorhynchi TaxID=2893756 RepID=UPI001E648425|nr:hypothetical protein [Myroides oncorhynchi]MCC9044055.1 hypothetical protein [Myroides oncorhynchi]